MNCESPSETCYRPPIWVFVSTCGCEFGMCQHHKETIEFLYIAAMTSLQARALLNAKVSTCAKCGKKVVGYSLDRWEVNEHL